MTKHISASGYTAAFCAGNTWQKIINDTHSTEGAGWVEGEEDSCFDVEALLSPSLSSLGRSLFSVPHVKAKDKKSHDNRGRPRAPRYSRSTWGRSRCTNKESSTKIKAYTYSRDGTYTQAVVFGHAQAWGGGGGGEEKAGGYRARVDEVAIRFMM